MFNTCLPGHLAQDCFHQAGGASYELLPEMDDIVQAAKTDIQRDSRTAKKHKRKKVSNIVVVIVDRTRLHSSRMRTVGCSGRHWGGWGVCPGGVCPGGWEVSARGVGGVCPGGVSAQGGVCQTPPPRGQNDRHLYKHHLSATTLRTVKIITTLDDHNIA